MGVACFGDVSVIWVVFHGGGDVFVCYIGVSALRVCFASVAYWWCGLWDERVS